MTTKSTRNTPIEKEQRNEHILREYHNQLMGLAKNYDKKPQTSELSRRYYEVLEEMIAIHDRKRHDYADSEDIFQNFRTSEMMGLPAWKGVCIRLGDKFSRIMGFAKKEKLEVKDESIRDTLIDMANYAIITLVLYEESQKNETRSELRG